MTETIAAEPAITNKILPTTAGMTTKVVKGSLWTLAGQIAPLAVSLVATPFTIRLLGAEGYGVLILVALIPTYLGFADLGMSIASTKFASEAYAEGDADKEARIVRTAALIAFSSSLPFATAIFLFSGKIPALFNVPEQLVAEASMALKFAAVTFAVNFLNSVFNTPQLTRLRMDLNTFVTSGFRILGIAATPIVIYVGGGIAGAAVVLLTAALLTLVGHLYLSSRLLPELFRLTLDRGIVHPLLRFGGAVVFVGVAGVVLINVEKGLVAAMVSVTALAFYTVASTLANMMILLSNTMIQSLVPAFSQLNREESVMHMESLFARIVKMSVLCLIPIAAFLVVGARYLIGIWAGAEFAGESSVPFYVLLAGLLFSVPGYVPYSLLMGTGRANLIAKLYWAEIAPYLLIVYFCTSQFGIVGTAAAWSLRVAFDGFVFFVLARKNTGANLRVLDVKIGWFVIAVAVYLPMIAFVFYSGGSVSVLTVIGFVLASAIYLLISWKYMLRQEERNWLVSIPIPNRLQTVK